jgi:hypothetical protein
VICNATYSSGSGPAGNVPIRVFANLMIGKNTSPAIGNGNITNKNQLRTMCRRSRTAAFFFVWLKADCRRRRNKTAPGEIKTIDGFDQTASINLSPLLPTFLFINGIGMRFVNGSVVQCTFFIRENTKMNQIKEIHRNDRIREIQQTFLTLN